MSEHGCKKVWSGDLGFLGLYSRECVSEKSSKSVKPSVPKKIAATEVQKSTSSYEKCCDIYVGDLGFVGMVMSRIWCECNSK